ncbi:nonribosomal peptide synthetase [Diplodia corticola]|uniref:Nonribosomal peptide synthetase n=1 Tax=Diplodia corticola TaxID=236234 RepID=A0A1J9SBD7_9PEZI|nr:nonribosomal peptide synthetase [Diplodia corticola]OJD36901.1 nonribosomal peptide synthetase [Diplodia corticola]
MQFDDSRPSEKVLGLVTAAETYPSPPPLEDLEAALSEEFWTSFLAESQPAAFPCIPYGSREPIQHEVVECHQELPTAASSKLELSALLFAAWGITTASYTGVQNIVFGAVVPDSGGINNPVPFRLNADSKGRVRDLLDQSLQRVIQCCQHASLGIEKISQLNGDCCHACNFETVLMVRHGAKDEDSVWPVPESQGLVITCSLVGRRLQITASVHSRAAEAPIMHRVIRQFGYTAARLATSEDQNPSVDDLLRVPNLHDLEEIWHHNQHVSDGTSATVQQLIAEQTRTRPSAAAVDAWDGILSYDELDHISTRLARTLRETSIEERSLVPFCLEHSKWAVVAMLGILKAGCAFVPIDPSAPRARRHRILQLARAKVILTSPNMVDNDFELTPVIRLSEDGLNASPTDGATFTGSSSVDSAAYVLFTSGSTGDPKGVAMGHRAIYTSLNAIGTKVGLHSGTRTLQFASLAFNISIFEILGTLAFRGCVCIPSDADRLSRLPEYMASAKVNTASLTPSVARLYSPGLVPSLETLVLGGEAITQADMKRWNQLPKLFNGFGPTECAVGCAIHRVHEEQKEPSIVGGLKGIPSWVVDPGNHDVLVPFGAVGELVIEGPTLAQGYLDNIAKTKAAFIQDPQWLLRGCGSRFPGRRGRVYKTGDLVKYNQQGELIYIGRKDADTQVKVRGNRVDLGEIEFRLLQCLPPGTEAVVEAFKPSNTDVEPTATLAVFLYPPAESRVQQNNMEMVVMQPPKDVQDRLSETLPSYIIPGVYFSVSVIPKTTSDKTDRKRLRELASAFSLQDLSSRLSSPADDSFFKLGEDSIGAIRLVKEAREEFNISLDVADIFRYPTLEGLVSVSKDFHVDASPVTIPFSALPVSQDMQLLCRVVIDSYSLTSPELVKDIYPCTPLQEGLLSLSSKHTGAYTVQRVLELAPGLDLCRFLAAWERMTKSTPIIRTRIVQHEELGLLQAVVDEKIQWKRVEKADMDAFIRADMETPMRLDQPLARYALIQGTSSTAATATPQFMVWTVHHALYDGWSLPLILERVREAYDGTELSSSGFAPFVKWCSQEAVRDNAVKFWESHLDGLSESALFPPLPSSVSEPVEDSTAEHRWEMPKDSAAGVTTSILLRAAWAIVASRYTSSDDVVFGTTVSGRNAPVRGIECVLGPTVATIPTRFKVHDSTPVRAFLARTQNEAVEAIPCEQTGLQRIAGVNAELAKVRDIQTFLVVQPSDYNVPSFDGFGKWVNGPGYYRLDVSALTLECFLGDSGVRCVAYFDSRVIERETVERLLPQFAHVSQQLSSASEDTTLGDVEVLTPADLKDIWAWNGPLLETAPEPLPHRDVHHQAEMRPHAPAVHSWDGELTYKELDLYSTLFAKKLVMSGIRPGDVVPLYFEPSEWAVVAMLAALKAGAAFVPIDASQPAAQRERILSQLPPNVVLASSKHTATSFGAGWSALEMSRETVDLEATGALPTVDPGSIAWIIFTSGSTGLPKGAMLQHSAVHASHRKLGATFGLHADTRMLQFSSFAFDACVLEIIATLMHGGCVCIPSEADQRSLSGLPQACAAMRVNTMVLTPTVARLFETSDFPDLTTLVLTGEPLVQSDVDKWATTAYVANGYGPAECSNICTVHRIAPGDSDPNRIGSLRGVPGWVVRSQDHNRLVPIGGVGELVVEGATVGSGYLNDAAKTAAAFITDPDWLVRGRPGEPQSGRRGRLYKTGDLVKLHPDGGLTYIGRKDTQIKIRGQRVELGEIEHHVLLQCAGALEAVVDAVHLPGRGDAKSLVAFVRLQDSSIPAPQVYTGSDDVADRLADIVPAYMVPAVFIQMPSVPRTASGKTDRKQLREVAAATMAATSQTTTAGSQPRRPKRAPRTETEKKLQQLWTKVLDRDVAEIGLDDSFVRLGGDSIAAMKLVSLAAKSSIGLTVAQVFRHLRLEDQARSATLLAKRDDDRVPPFSLLPRDADVDLLRADAAESCAVEAVLIEDLYPCTPSQEGLLSLSARHAEQNAYVLQHVFDLAPTLDVRRMRSAWEETVRTTDILRTRVVHHARHGLLQVVVNDGISWCEPEDIHAFIEADKQRPMGLGTPLARYAISQDARTKHTKLVWTIHHALGDGWALNLVLNKVEAIYRASSTVSSPLSEFRGFIKYMNGRDVDSMVEYWRDTLADVEPVTFPLLPTAVRDAVEDSEVELDHSLPESAATASASLSTILRAAWAIVQSRHSNTDDVVFGEVLSGRSAPVPSIDSLVGPTMVTVPVRVKLPAALTVPALLQNIHTTSTLAIPHEQLGLHRIARINPAACAFQTLLIIQPPTAASSDDPPRLLSASPDYRLATYALAIECTPSPSSARRLGLRARFDSRAVSAAAARRLLAQLGHVADQLMACAAASVSASDPGPGPPPRLVSGVAVHAPRELRDVWGWNGAPQGEEGAGLVHEAVRARAIVAPGAVAVEAWDGRLSYGRLEGLADGLAAALAARGVGVGRQGLVPLCFEKSVWVVVAMLAVLKTGAGVVLLDPGQPAGRHERVLAALGPGGVLLASTSCAEHRKFRDGWEVVVVCESGLQAAAASSRHFVSPRIPESAACWVLFTSGSTGEPKGVVLEHGAVSKSYGILIETLGITRQTRMLQFSAYAFDVSTLEMMGVLMAGGCVCIPSDTQRLEGLAEFCTSFRVNTAMLTPSVARLYDPQDLPTLRSLSLLGEAPTKQDILKWQRRIPHLFNAYGPAEAACLAAVHRVDPHDDDPIAARIGRLAGVPVWIVAPDDCTKLAPVGAVGELLIEGSTLARGYLNPAHTAAAFIEDPEWLLRPPCAEQISGRRGRLYRTGDLARYAEDGGLVYEGRKDSQIKIRGQRTELGEIEFHLAQCIPDAAEVVVETVAGEGDSATSTTLVGFVKFLSATAPTTDSFDLPSEVESQLGERLPAYMIPSVFLSVPQIPKTASDKTDRKKLKALAAVHAARALEARRLEPQRGPSSAMEQKLLFLWSQALSVAESNIGMDSNFFKLGGDSISALKLVGEARRAGIQLSVVDIFQTSKLDGLARCAEGRAPARNDAADIPRFSLLPGSADTQAVIDHVAFACGLSPGLVQDVYPCTPMQEGLMTLASRSSGTYVSQVVVELVGHIDLDLLRSSWERTVRDTAVMRTRIVQHPQLGFLQAVTNEEVSWESSTDFESYIAEDDALRPGFGSRLSRYGLIQNPAGGPARLVWTVHHAIYDMVTLRLVFDRVAAAYKGGQGLQAFPAYASFVKYVLGSQTADAEEYWRQTLKHNTSAAVFPPLPAPGHQPCEDTVMEHSYALTRAPSSVTTTTILHAAWAMVTSWHTSTPDVLFGTVRSGRTAPIPSISTMPGPTMATIPLGIAVAASDPIRAFLHRVQTQTAAAMPHEQLGLQSIARLSGACARACAFQTLFAVQEGRRREASVGGGGVAELGALVETGTYALKTYALTLECFPDGEGFDVRAWFDSAAVGRWRMERALRQLGAVAHQLADGAEGDGLVGGVRMLDARDWEDVREWGARRGYGLWVVLPDDCERLAPVGAVGELLVGGPDIPAEYLGQGDAEFVQRPSWMEATGSASALKTGILTQYTDEGTLTTIGRKRTTVCVGGQYADTSEIERHMVDALPDGYQSVVELLALQGRPDDELTTMLTAFLLPPDGDASTQVTAHWAPKAREIERRLAAKLPHYMIPSIYLQVTATPRTRSGSVDRSQLRMLGTGFSVADVAKMRETQRVVPDTETQFALRDLWATVLRRDADGIGLDDSFFQLGGDSIGAIKLVTEARRRGIVLTAADIFQHPQLEALAERVGINSSRQQGFDAAEPFSLVADDDDAQAVEGFLTSNVLPYIDYGRDSVLDVLPGTWMQKEFFKAGGLLYHLSLDFGEARIDPERLRSAARQLLQRHSILRTIFLPHNTELLQITLDSGSISNFVAEALEDGETIEMAADRLTTQYKLDEDIIGRPMPHFVFLSGNAQGRSVSRLLILGISHMQFDGFSMPFIVRDLGALYDGDQLASVPHFASYVYAHHAIPPAERQMHWRRLLRGSSMTPIATGGGNSQSLDHDVYVTRVVSPETWRRLRSSNAEKRWYSPDDVLTTAWALTLAIVSRESDVVFGHTVAGRRTFSLGGGGADGVLGPCVNTVPVRVRLPSADQPQRPGSMTLQDVLAKVSDQSAQTMPFESTGLDEIVENYAPPTWDASTTRWGSTVVWQDFAGMQALETQQDHPTSDGQQEGEKRIAQDSAVSGYMDPFATSSHVSFGGVPCIVTCDVPAFDPADVAVIGRPVNGSASFSLAFSKTNVSESVMEKTVAVLVQVFESLVEQPGMEVGNLLAVMREEYRM